VSNRLIADIFVTTVGLDRARPGQLFRSLRSLRECTRRELYRLTVVVDGESTALQAHAWEAGADYVLVSRQNEGLGPSINRALAHIDATNNYYDCMPGLLAGPVTQYICYCQDDLQYTDGWLERLAKLHCLHEMSHKVVFSSGLECVEHPVKRDLGNGLVLKDWIRAAQMFGQRRTWMSMFPIPRFDPETGRERAKPSDGVGSGVDWHFIRNHTNSVCKTGRSCLVIPGLVQHAGWEESTWLDRPLPESAKDKALLRG
jgi:glycosyltransferase involved in cell wall biosynthesis